MNNRFLKIIAALCFFIPMLGGCVLTERREQISLLKSLGENQSKIERYVKRQQALFYKLEHDLKNNRLKKGISKGKILSAYGDPIFCEYIENDLKINESCLYRHPTKYFSGDMIYLDFDTGHNLSRWELRLQ